MNRRVRPADIVCVVAVVAIWAAFLLIARIGAKQTFTPWDLVFLRFVFASAVVLPLFLWRPAGGRLGGLSLQRALIVALIAGVAFSCFAFLGFSFAPVAHAAVLMPGTLPFWTALAATLILGERVTARRAGGLGLILIGIGFIAWHSFSGIVPGAWRGDILFPLASMCWATFVVLTRHWRIDALDACIASSLFGFLLYAPVYLLFLPKRLLEAPWSEIVFQGVFHGVLALVVSMWLFTRVVQAFGPTRTTMITAVTPALAAALAVPLLGEPLTLLVVLGLCAVTAGMISGLGEGARGAAAPADAPKTVG